MEGVFQLVPLNASGTSELARRFSCRIGLFPKDAEVLDVRALDLACGL